MELKELIKNLAYARGTTISKVESRCGLGNGSIRLWEKGRYPSADRLYRVAGFLGTSVDEIMKECMGNESDNQ